MSTLKVNKLRDTAGSTDAITLDPNGGAVLAGVTTVTSVKVGAAVTISESGIEASGIGITCANINGQQISGRRNVLINGAMQVVQRGTSFTSVGSDANTYLMDRFKMYVQNSTARFTVTQDSDSPDEFGGSMKIDCTTADTSLASTDEVYLEQRIEGQDLQHFAKGTSSAKQYTLSFYAKTTKTGTYIVNLLSRDNTTGSVSASYTVSDTNWNRYVITFPADTNSNRKDNNDSGEALRILWWFVAGSAVNSGTLNTSWANSSDTGRATGQVNFSDSTSNDFYLTGCQLEVGPQATAFEHRSLGEELALCQRYYETNDPLSTALNTNGSISSQWAYMGANDGQTLLLSTGVVYKTVKRANPTVTLYNPSDTSTANRADVQGTERTVTAVYGSATAATRVYVTGGSTGNYVTYNWEASAEL